MNPLIIGVGGWATAGKDSFVDGIVGGLDPNRKPKWVRTYMSEPLEKSLRTLNPIVGIKFGDFEHRDEATEWLRFDDLCNEVGYDAAKKNPEVRRLLITMGTEVGREQFDPQLWVKIMERKMLDAISAQRNFVVTGIRFRNELETLHLYNAATVWISRPGVEPVANHQSENTLGPQDFDDEIWNDGSIEDLHKKAQEWVDSL